MKRKRFTEEQIIGILKEAEGGKEHRPLPAPSHQRANVLPWKAKHAGLEVNEARRLRILEHENTRLKRLVADLTLDNQALKDEPRDSRASNMNPTICELGMDAGPTVGATRLAVDRLHLGAELHIG
jgi:putative transposase